VLEVPREADRGAVPRGLAQGWICAAIQEQPPAGTRPVGPEAADRVGKSFMAMMKDCDAFLLGRRTYVTHADAFEPLPPGDPFGDVMNPPAKYVVSKTLQAPRWRNTTIIREDPVAAFRALKAQPGKNILTDGSSQLVHTLLAHDLVDELHLLLYPLMVGGGKRLFADGRRLFGCQGLLTDGAHGG
jgi:dihydrofolate reductase